MVRNENGEIRMEIPLGEIVGSLVGVGGGVHTFFQMFRFVREGEKGIKLRFGKAKRRRNGTGELEPIVYEPGFTMLIPYVDTLVRRHVRVQTIELPQQTITIKNGLSYIVDAVVRFQVKDIYKALFVVDNLDQTMNNVAMAELRDTLTPYEDEEAMADVHGMSEKLTAKIKKHSSIWGVEIEQFSIVSCVPTPESQQIVNVKAGVKSRIGALQDGFRQLGIEKDAIAHYPQLAAALVGIPVATAIGTSPTGNAQFAPPKRSPAVSSDAERSLLRPAPQPMRAFSETIP
jgi:regulator of protease activity HflC (stomatin/prohibitin superfamily)